ncbi:alpha/beta-Hydrolase [Glarea lozoyensis ATCC 20868]|uniref:Alpha/beta-Hydrolase n=1 Tax=Glarea lozoyensis (strain ATCC 20868 / MF5171) TaxID=1116229 RepID=S3CZ08_GLAL2|nr:alpha/beta-Hydrolase [Glarea lozoyensis ATCC 20868]EPE25071.1 alpha/beta-Hydrolase [Glarea lozoyensis ATCC 20868]
MPTLHLLRLHIQALFFRTLQRIFTTLDLSYSHPLPKPHSFIRTIPSTHSKTLGSIDLFFYTSASHKSPPSSPEVGVKERRPLLVNFHGGGYAIGHARDDARFFTAITSSTNTLVVSVNYRLAPSHPFPTAIEDGVSAVLYLWEHADELGIDVEKTVISGFSAGGALAYGVSIKLAQVLEGMGGKGGSGGMLRGLVVFYGGCDFTLSRAEKDASNKNLIPVIPPMLYRFFDSSYLQGNPDKLDPLLSPGLADDEILRKGIPENVAMVNCGGDQLLAESTRFGERLKGLGKSVEVLVVEGVGHAWDKKASWKKGNAKRDEAYRFAVENLKEMWS